MTQDVVQGSSVIDQILRYLDITAGHAGAASGLAGWIDPAMLGLGGNTMLPTLARERYEQERREAERNYALDVARFGLDQAQLNFQQRMGAADTRLRELSLLASQRGPGDSIAYNYALRGLSAPEGQQVSPHQSSGSINQPVNITVPTSFGGGSTGYGTPPVSKPPVLPPVTPTPQPNLSGGEAFDAYAATPQANTRPIEGQAGGVEITNPGGTNIGFSQEVLDMMRENPALAAGFGFKGMAQGGVAGGNPDGRMLMLGDDEGKRTHNEELLLNPTNAPLGVVPPEAVSDEMVASAKSGGEPTPEEILMLIGRLIESLGIGEEAAPSPGGEMMQPPMGAPPMMAAQDGGIFGTTLYSGEEIAGQPALQAIAGSMNLPAFGATGLNMQMPGSDTTIPMGHQANIQQVSRMLPSEVQQLQGAIETPREMGGLGLVFGDWLQSMMRAAPVGRSVGTAAYG